MNKLSIVKQVRSILADLGIQTWSSNLFLPITGNKWQLSVLSEISENSCYIFNARLGAISVLGNGEIAVISDGYDNFMDNLAERLRILCEWYEMNSPSIFNEDEGGLFYENDNARNYFNGDSEESITIFPVSTLAELAEFYFAKQERLNKKRVELDPIVALPF